jgi:hypothetical protein
VCGGARGPISAARAADYNARPTNPFAPIGAPAVPDPFDPYREALVMEISTIWPAEYEDLSAAEKARLEEKLHAQAKDCSQLEYIRTHTGFCRQITVTPADVERVGG